MTHHSVQPRDQILVKVYRFLSFAKSMGTNLRSKYNQKLLDHDKKSGTDALKTASKKLLLNNTPS